MQPIVRAGIAEEPCDLIKLCLKRLLDMVALASGESRCIEIHWLAGNPVPRRREKPVPPLTGAQANQSEEKQLVLLLPILGSGTVSNRESEMRLEIQ
jgi:hypothetical protein